jgi:hypothetical protein
LRFLRQKHLPGITAKHVFEFKTCCEILVILLVFMGILSLVGFLRQKHLPGIAAKHLLELNTCCEILVILLVFMGILSLVGLFKAKTFAGDCRQTSF